MQMFNFKISYSSILRAILFLYLDFAVGLYRSPNLTIYPQLIRVLLSLVFFGSVLVQKSEFSTNSTLESDLQIFIILSRPANIFFACPSPTE